MKLFNVVHNAVAYGSYFENERCQFPAFVDPPLRQSASTTDRLCAEREVEDRYHALEVDTFLFQLEGAPTTPKKAHRGIEPDNVSKVLAAVRT